MDKFLGVAEDPRIDLEKVKDYSFSEVAFAVPLDWVEKQEYKRFTRRDQDGSSSCMAQSGVKMLGIENVLETGNFLELSATPVYQKRANKPAGGMWLQDCLSILSKPVACLESQVPSQNMSESQIDASYEKTQGQLDTSEMYRASGYATIPVDIDKIASIISEGKGVQLILFFNSDEWWNNKVPVIKYDTKLETSLHHGVCVVDYTLYQGKKALIIEDSAALQYEDHQRIITEDFLVARCFGAGYLLELSNNHVQKPSKPKYIFSQPIEFGQTSADVKALQDFLKWSGDFPTTIPSTGYYGSVTAGAILKFQLRNGLTDFQYEKDIRKIRVGSKTLTLLNQ